MKIVKLTAENVLRLHAVEVTPDGNVVTITGKNGAGKSSLLNAIFLALGGGPATKNTTKPIRDGENRAEVSVDLGDLIVTRTWTRAGNTMLKVETRDGAVHKSPQQLLNSLLGRYSFDPLEFAQQPEREQLETLLGLVDLPFDPAQIDAQRKELYDERTIVGREADQLKGQLAGVPEPDPDIPDSETSLGELLERYEAIRAEHARQDDVRQEVSNARADRDLAQEALDRATDNFRNALAALEKAEDEERKLTPPPSLEAIQREIEVVEDTNYKVRAAHGRERVASALKQAHKKYRAHTDQIADLDKLRRDGIAKAKFPIEGLGFDEGGVTYRGMPFKQCSSAEQLRVSLAMAMALNPKIRVIRITDGSLLDADNLKLIEEMAADQDFQIWVERVSDDSSVGIHIEDGAIANA